MEGSCGARQWPDLACLPPQHWDLPLLPLGVVQQYSGLLALAERFLVTSLGLGMWECLNPGLFVHPSLR